MKGFGLDYFFGIFDGLKNLSLIKKNDFNKISILDIIMTEIYLIINTLKYVNNFIKRKL